MYSINNCSVLLSKVLKYILNLSKAKLINYVFYLTTFFTEYKNKMAIRIN